MTVTQSVLGDFADTDAGALLPCTSTQTGMVFETITRSPAVYLEQIVVRLREQVDARCMQEAWVRLAARHDAMRLSFEIGQATSLRQRVAPTVRVPFVERDWRRLEPFEQEKRWRDLLRADRQGGFALESAPLFRVTLCQIADADFRMLFTHHHAIIDGYAGVTVQLELFAIYDSLRAGAEINLPEPDSFQSFVEWASLQGADENGLDFWRRALAGIEEPTPAPIGDDDDDGEGSAGVAEIRLGTELSARLGDFCARCEMSLATVLQGAFAVLLSQEVAQDDLLYATTRAGRRSPPMDTHRMVGVLMVASPVRLRMSRELSFQDLLAQIRDLSL
ncbi:MAG TPA: condensation domain-containing protein, partial [Solirubrobacteraceae bacterium]|nr:condensation domain-containing protein [Solirubrobacteraceae bacterium]